MDTTETEHMARVAEIVDLWRMGGLAADEALDKVRSKIGPPAEQASFGSDGEGEIYDKGLG